MKKILALTLTLMLILTAFAGAIPASAASVDTIAPLSVKADKAPVGDYFEPCYDEPLDIFFTLFGDADTDGTITIKDATIIQKAIAVLVTLDEESLFLSDVTGDFYITINDATAIQKYVAGIEKSFPVFAKYSVQEDKKGTEFKCISSGYAQIDFTLAEDAFYSFSISGNGGTEDIAVLLCDEQGLYITSAIPPELYSSDLSMRLPLKAGNYKVVVYGTENHGFTGRINYTTIEDQFYFRTNKDGAVELKTFESDKVPADVSARLYKIHNDSDLEDTLVFYPTVEENDALVTDVFVTVYSERMEILGTFDTIFSENLYIHLNTLNLPKDEYFYIYAYAPKYVNGNSFGFTAHLTTHTRYVLENSSQLECDSPVKIEGNNEYTDNRYADIGYRFTPAADGYYKFMLKSGFSLNITYGNLAICDEGILDYNESSIISYKNMTIDGEDSDYVSAYLKAGTTYYVFGSVQQEDYISHLTITAQTCTKEEYEQSYTEIPKPVEIPEAEEIFIGDTKKLNINHEDGEIIYKFVSSSADELVFFSEGNGDPLINIYDEYGNHITYEDDIHYHDSKLNFALYGYVDAGETYYIGVSCHDEAKTDITFSIVREKDYIYE